MDDLPQGALSQFIQPSTGALILWPQTIFKNDLGGGWSQADIARQLGYLTLHGVDWAQTREVAKNPGEYRETNKILGEHPSVGAVNNYFAATALGHMLLSDLLPPEYRKLFQLGTMGMEAAVTGENRAVTGKNRFKFGIGMTF